MIGSADSPAAEVRLTMIQKNLRRGGAAATALILAFTLAACAPEPEPAEFHGKNPIEEGESEYPAPPDDAFVKNVELPESFPVDAFPVPTGTSIDDTGEPSPGQWFLVLSAPDATTADAAWNQIINEGGFAAAEIEELPEGGVYTTLTSASLVVEALTLPQEDGSVLLSYTLSTAL